MAVQAGGQKYVPVKCGVMATLAKGMLLDARHRWARMGFMSRLLPVSFEYGTQTQFQIHQSIAQRQYRGSSLVQVQVPDQDIDVDLPSAQASDLQQLSAMVVGAIAAGPKTPDKVYGFRLQKHLQRLAMARSNKRSVATALIHVAVAITHFPALWRSMLALL